MQRSDLIIIERKGDEEPARACRWDQATMQISRISVGRNMGRE
jgi:hypothetical protein